jgi:hypothetical protein
VKPNRAKKLSRILKELSHLEAPGDLQDATALGMGGRKLTWNELIAAQILSAAAAGKQWAIELFRDQTEGKPAQAKSDDAGDRSADERLEDNLRHHLNRLVPGGAEAVVVQPEPARPDLGDDEGAPGPAERAPAPARSFLDLPEDGDRDPEDDD